MIIPHITPSLSMILIDKYDSIVDILKKISDEDDAKIILSFPFGHPVLHNHISLKIIKTHSKKKHVLILTNDKLSYKIGKPLGIYYKKNKKLSTLSAEVGLKPEDDSSFLGYTLFECKRLFLKVQGNSTSSSFSKSQKKYRKIYGKIIPFFSVILVVIIFILSYIFYFAINKTTIVIHPETNVKRKSRNYNYVEKLPLTDISQTGAILPAKKSPANLIHLTKIEEEVSISQIFNTSGFKQLTNNTSHGKVLFYNYLHEDVHLLSGSTLQTQNGLHFTLPSPLFLPGAHSNKKGATVPTTSEQTLYNKIQRVNGTFSGSNSNISKGTLLIISKLGEDKDKIFAKSTSAFTGGNNKIIPILLESDVSKSVELMKAKLQEKAINAIKEEVERQNKINNVHMEVLPVDGMYKFSHIQVHVPDHLEIGSEYSEFELTGSIHVTSYIYNIDSVISKLQNIITQSIIPESEKLISINSSSLRISHILKRNDYAPASSNAQYLNILPKRLNIKATTELEYYASKNFTSTYNNNNSLLNIKMGILGKTPEAAELYLLNHPEINNVSISIRPFFLKYISKIPEHIEIIIEK